MYLVPWSITHGAVVAEMLRNRKDRGEQIPKKAPLKVGSDKCNKFKLFVLRSDFASRAVNRNSEI